MNHLRKSRAFLKRFKNARVQSWVCENQCLQVLIGKISRCCPGKRLFPISIILYVVYLRPEPFLWKIISDWSIDIFFVILIIHAHSLGLLRYQGEEGDVMARLNAQEVCVMLTRGNR